MEKKNFGNLAITVQVTHSFASHPHRWFAFIDSQRTQGNISYPITI